MHMLGSACRAAELGSPAHCSVGCPSCDPVTHGHYPVPWDIGPHLITSGKTPISKSTCVSYWMCMPFTQVKLSSWPRVFNPLIDSHLTDKGTGGFRGHRIYQSLHNRGAVKLVSELKQCGSKCLHYHLVILGSVRTCLRHQGSTLGSDSPVPSPEILSQQFDSKCLS